MHCLYAIDKMHAVSLLGVYIYIYIYIYIYVYVCVYIYIYIYIYIYSSLTMVLHCYVFVAIFSISVLVNPISFLSILVSGILWVYSLCVACGVTGDVFCRVSQSRGFTHFHVVLFISFCVE